MALNFRRDMDPRYGEAVAIAPGIRRVTARNPGPFTFLGTNAWLVGTDRLAIVDPGPGDPDQLAALLAAVAGAKVEAIVVTHSHRDHSPGARALAEATGAPVYASEQRAPAPGTSGAMDASFDRKFRPDHIVGDGDRIELPGFTLEAIATPGHTADHLAFALAGSPFLFSGDHVMAWATTVVAPPEGSMAAYMASLDRLLERPESRYLSGHGPEVEAAHRFVKALKTHRNMRERTILERLGEGASTIPDLVLRNYPDLDPKLRGAAGLSTLAHIEDLVARGLVTAISGSGREALYGLSSSGSASSSPESSPPRP